MQSVFYRLNVSSSLVTLECLSVSGIAVCVSECLIASGA